MITRHCPLVQRCRRNIKVQQTIYSNLIFSWSPRCCCCCCCCCREVRSAVHARSRLGSRFRAVGAYMAFLATPVSPPHGGTTFGGFGAAAIATGSRGRATTHLVGASTASTVFSPPSAFSCPPSFPALSLAGPANPWLGQPRQLQQILCVPSCRNSATHNGDFRGAPLATDLSLAPAGNLS